jgi:hypothetical protein
VKLIAEISGATSITLDDVYATLVSEDMITSHDSPPRIRAAHTPIQRRRSRGRSRLSAPRRSQAVVAIEEPHDPHEIPNKPQLPKRYTIRFDRAYIEAVLNSYESKGHLTLKFDRLKYHPFLVSREIKPPTSIAIIKHVDSKSVDSIPEPEVETPDADADPEVINHGQDKATLDLVARLAEEGEGVRSLRKRSSTSRAPDSGGKRLRTRSANTVVVESPRRSLRATAPVVETPTADLDLDGEWEVDDFLDGDGEEDAEGEEYEE